MTTERRVLIVDDDEAILESVEDLLQSAGYATATAGNGEAALAVMARERIDLVVSDGQMSPMDGYTLLREVGRRYPQTPVVLMSAYSTVGKAVDAMKNHAAHYLVKPFGAEELLQLAEQLLAVNSTDSRLVANDPCTLEIRNLAARVAASDATVLLSGPSGVGKEVFARHIHDLSGRRDGPFVALNCAAIPENMLEAMLFGYERGAFTGATSSHVGKFEQAQHGTLLLDEISEMDLGLQAKLLRVLQERELERLGGKATVSLDVRVLATTNRDLREAVKAGTFREDLYYRLNVFPLRIPALRDRPGDILPLAEFFIRRGSGSEARRRILSEAAAGKLLGYDWPGNVRELDNVIQRALILQVGERVEAEDIQFEDDRDLFDRELQETEQFLESRMKDQEWKLINDALNASRSKKEAAAILGISPRTLRYKLARLREENFATG